ncbi:hypothetical protein LINGRAHAP2_LOCUS14540, partial [Linum grandiflorum]
DLFIYTSSNSKSRNPKPLPSSKFENPFSIHCHSYFMFGISIKQLVLRLMSAEVTRPLLFVL